MEGAKSIFFSKTFWGGALAVFSGLLGIFGYTFSKDDQETVLLLATSASGAIGGLYSIFGRVRADKKIE